ncbi:2-dehydropantoate 2-reductase [Halioglobus maricola]|nr:2-dehydropantoate 2-reductase [Halioglobus maricola]
MPTSWHILGAGAIGCLFADALTAQGITTTLVLRDCAASAPLLTLERDGKTYNRQLASTPASAADQISRLLVTTKAYDVVSAIGSVRHRLALGADVVLLVNGLGYADQVAQIAPDITLYSATTTEGVFRRGPWDFCHAGQGVTLVGAMTASAPADWFTPWQNLGLKCRWTESIEPALWHKLAINCAINPLTAIHRCQNGALATRPELAAQVRQLCSEIARVSAAAGFESTANNIEHDAFTVIENTAENRSSMLQDTLADRPTEIDFITGHLVARADQLGVAAPLNSKLLEQIRHA